MTVNQIAIGATYTLQNQALDHPRVVVESVEVHHTCTPGYYRPEDALKRALVWVYEEVRGLRYPTDPHHLRSGKETRCSHTPSAATPP